jgi:hypothetical protein
MSKQSNIPFILIEPRLQIQIHNSKAENNEMNTTRDSIGADV